MAVTDAELERTIQRVARIVELYGDAYWPVFERLEAEWKRRRSKEIRLKRFVQSFEIRPNKLASDLTAEVPHRIA